MLKIGQGMDSRWTGPPKMLVLDIDGTLVEPGRPVTDRVRRALRRAVDSGCHLVLATGRAHFEVVDFFREIGLPDGLAVCSNGSVVVTMPQGEVLATSTFDARSVLATLLEYVPAARIAVEVVDVGYVVTHPFPEDEILGPQLISNLDKILVDLSTVFADRVVRVVIRDPNLTREDFHGLTEHLSVRDVSYAVGFDAWLDLGPQGVSKASGLDKVAALLGVSPADALAIGDGYNDKEMILWAGRGVVMGHAPVALKELADHTTLPVGKDGAAVEIEKWF
ncbi:HAD family hydrolase [Nonomuraea sp. NPDC050153]|uniref:HAD family hydrolase n=1 Tax=Nonomuraea sp. NPDC050153 TaxID=3364359 RepID=UPI003796C0AD